MLSSACLPRLAARGVAVPTYLRDGAPGVVHLGLGAFHRAHQALVFDRLLASGDGRWGVLGVAMRQPALAQALAAQDHLYSVQTASAQARSWQVSGAIWQSCVAAESPHIVVQVMAAAATRWVTLTVTEKAYTPALAALLVQGLRARRAAGLGGLTVASCDNLSGNGRQLRALCRAAAAEQPDGLVDWIAARCAFPNSMVDRIVPAASGVTSDQAAQALGLADQAALRTEAFWEWVIERNFVDDSDAATLSAVGVQVVDEVAPFEEAKLRLLNGSHSAMACIGALAGLPVISDCIAQPAVYQLVHGLMTHELGPLLRRPDWPDYRDALLQRFANPTLQHSVHQIATDSSQKISQRWVPSALAALQAGLPVERLAFAAACWLRYFRGVDEQGLAYALADPLADTLIALSHSAGDDLDTLVATLGRLPAVWGATLPAHPDWLPRVRHWLGRIQAEGVLVSADAVR
ncbi:MAG: mannitol dehydrogenase family protein [Betaproteobacteria bacterium]